MSAEPYTEDLGWLHRAVEADDYFFAETVARLLATIEARDAEIAGLKQARLDVICEVYGHDSTTYRDALASSEREPR